MATTHSSYSSEELASYHNLLKQLLKDVLEKKTDERDLKRTFLSLSCRGYPDHLILLKTYESVIASILKIPLSSFHLEPFFNGMALLDTAGWCDSYTVPPPNHLAELAVLWMVLGAVLKRDIFKLSGVKLAYFNCQFFDLEGRCHLSFWSHMSSLKIQDLRDWSGLLFKMASYLTQDGEFENKTVQLLQEQQLPYAFPFTLFQFIEKEPSFSLKVSIKEKALGIIKFATSDLSIAAHLSGWNSGLFSFHKKKVAILNSGPQVGSYEDLKRFGINRGWQGKKKAFADGVWEKTAYHASLKGWTKLLASTSWIWFDCHVQAGNAIFSITLEDRGAFEDEISCVLFIQGEDILLGGNFFLRDIPSKIYEGKTVPLEVQAGEERLWIYPQMAPSMRLMALTPQESYGYAQFVLIFPLRKQETLKLEIK
ncbi:MAG: hypothetical protein QRY72_01575 [Candidatus Rhabdochlamydia sp.]